MQSDQSRYAEETLDLGHNNIDGVPWEFHNIMIPPHSPS
jgi:hypothetical protein